VAVYGRDAALVTMVPDGLTLSEATGSDLADGTLDEIVRAVLRPYGPAVWIILAVIVAALIRLVPRLRRLASRRIAR
jgi:putative exporter of polyketide antibiotics